MVAKLFFCLVVAGPLLQEVVGHGVLVDPPNRSTLWRYDPTQPANYNDNQLFCGGAYVQHELNGGRCGACGDSYSEPVPRPNENGGIYGNGIIVRNYNPGSVIDVQINLTANHLGAFTYSICELPTARAVENEECFRNLQVNGAPTRPVFKGEVHIIDQVQLPAGYSCNRCVLRWHYSTGNSWGVCNNGTQGIGCGPQETFRSCADISILPQN